MVVSRDLRGRKSDQGTEHEPTSPVGSACVRHGGFTERSRAAEARSARVRRVGTVQRARRARQISITMCCTDQRGSRAAPLTS